jgi:general nucleoside transport system permease protein
MPVLDALGTLLAATPVAATAILLAAMGGLLNRQAGIVNIGLEGIMLAGAFTAVVTTAATGNPLLGSLVAMLVGGLVGLLFSWTITRLGANEIIVGLGLNLLVVGLLGYLLPVLYGVQGTLIPAGLVGLPNIDIPFVADVPFLGPIISGHDPITYLSWLSVPLMSWFLYRTSAGIDLRAVGANEEAARSAGIATLRVRDASTVVAGMFAGLAGAQLALGVVTLFNKNMTGGRGFIALAAFYFGDARPGLTALGALIFSVFELASFRLQSSGLPPQVVQMLPYLVVVASLTFVGVRRTRSARRRATLVATAAVGEGAR